MIAISQIVVSLSPKDAAEKIEKYVLGSGFSIECVNSYSNISSTGQEVIVLVFEKYFMRNSSRASLTVCIENINGQTTIYRAGSGGGNGVIFNFDFGAADSFANLVDEAIYHYQI